MGVLGRAARGGDDAARDAVRLAAAGEFFAERARGLAESLVGARPGVACAVLNEAGRVGAAAAGLADAASRAIRKQASNLG